MNKDSKQKTICATYHGRLEAALSLKAARDLYLLTQTKTDKLITESRKNLALKIKVLRKKAKALAMKSALHDIKIAQLQAKLQLEQERCQMIKECEADCVDIVTKIANIVIAQNILEHPETLKLRVIREINNTITTKGLSLRVHPDDLELMKPVALQYNLNLQTSTEQTPTTATLISGQGELAIDWQIHLSHLLQQLTSAKGND